MKPDDDPLRGIPLAHARPKRAGPGLKHLGWWLTLTVVAALFLVIWLGPRSGEPLTIRFRHGHGLMVGDAMRLRGIDVGRVESIELSPGLDEIVVQCRITRGAVGLAREGSRFWIVRPTLSLTSIQGLETLVRGRYLAVAPGRQNGRPCRAFVGLDEPPTPSEMSAGGLELILQTDDRSGIVRGSPVRFRGMPVGEVLSLGMASDGLTIEARAWINPGYRSLVCRNSVFWNDSGVGVRLGYSGVALDMGTLETIATGGISFATPDETGKPVYTGHRFTLNSDAPRNWKEWKPNLFVGNTWLPDRTELPVPLNAELRFTKRLLGIARELRRASWIVPLDDGRILIPRSLLGAKGTEIQDPVYLAFAGQERQVDLRKVAWVGALIEYRVPRDSLPTGAWPVHKLRVPTSPEDCLLIGRVGDPPLVLSSSRLTADGDRWSIDPAVPVTQSLSGAAVVSRADGALIGLVDLEEGAAFVAPPRSEP